MRKPIGRIPMPTLEVGTAIEARFGGDEDYFAGRVETINGDGTYGVLYADGDSEVNEVNDMDEVNKINEVNGDIEQGWQS